MSNTKESLIQNLKNVKLIIGNGFDLYCGLKTSYSDYFENNKLKNGSIERWTNDFQNKVADFLRISSQPSNQDAFWVEPDDFESINFWDVLFYLESRNEPSKLKQTRWCDIESTMLNWLESRAKAYSSSPLKGIEYIYDYLNHVKPLDELDSDILYLTSFVIRKSGKRKFENRQEFYNFLLDELKKFEHEFGLYIYRQQYEGSFPNRRYFGFSKNLVKRLCPINYLTSIDTFNYGEPFQNDDDLIKLVHHINGDTEFPIFGVDSDAFITSGRELDPRYIFTKTYRRTELDMSSDRSEELKSLDNIVIFGCSLAPADYSYFFAVFDKLKLTDIDVNSKVVFAYNVFDEEKRDEIKSDLVKSIFELFQEYSRYKGNKDHPNRLLDSLTAQGKIVIYEITR